MIFVTCQRLATRLQQVVCANEVLVISRSLSRAITLTLDYLGDLLSEIKATDAAGPSQGKYTPVYSNYLDAV